MTKFAYKFFPNVGLAAEASCSRCSWTVTTTDPDLIDTLYTDASDHEREAHAHECQW
jgi:hypothetical protein